MGIRDNTLIMVVSDNGASQEGLQNGTLNTDRYRNYFPDTVEEMLDKLDEAGGPSTDPHYPMGWAMAGNSPLKRWKQDTHAGGNTDPFIVSWPAKIKDGGAIRNQYHHIIDVVPTILEVTGLPAPASVNGVKQMPLHGVSMAYSFTDGAAKTRKPLAVLRDARQPGHLGRRLEGRDLAQEGHPLGRGPVGALPHRRRLHRVERPRRDAPREARGAVELWLAEAKKYNVLPLDDRRYERAADPTRPVAALPRSSTPSIPAPRSCTRSPRRTLLGKITRSRRTSETPGKGRRACCW